MANSYEASQCSDHLKAATDAQIITLCVHCHSGSQIGKTTLAYNQRRTVGWEEDWRKKLHWFVKRQTNTEWKSSPLHVFIKRNINIQHSLKSRLYILESFISDNTLLNDVNLRLSQHQFKEKLSQLLSLNISSSSLLLLLFLGFSFFVHYDSLSHTCSAHGGQKRASDMIVSYHVGAGNLTRVLWRCSQCSWSLSHVYRP